MPVREATVQDAMPMALAFAAIAAERRWIATEPPVDLDARAASFAAMVHEPHAVVLVALDEDGEVVGNLGLEGRRGHDVVHLGMGIVARARGRGLGGELLDAGIAAARAHGGWRKIALEVWPHNERAMALYASRGFVVEAVRRDRYLRRDGTRRSAVAMGLLLR